MPTIFTNIRYHQDQRKQDSQSLRSCWSHYPMWVASSNASSSYRGRQSISKSTRRSCGVYFTLCTRREENCSWTNCNCFTTTMKLYPISWASGSSWNNLPIHLILHRVTFSFHKAQGDHQKDSFWRRGGHQEGCNDETEEHSRRILPAVLKTWQRSRGKYIRLEWAYFQTV